MFVRKAQNVLVQLAPSAPGRWFEGVTSPFPRVSQVLLPPGRAQTSPKGDALTADPPGRFSRTLTLLGFSCSEGCSPDLASQRPGQLGSEGLHSGLNQTPGPKRRQGHGCCQAK